MADLLLARPWAAVRPQMEAAKACCTVQETRSPRVFFAVDAAALYVVRVRESDGGAAVTLTPAPARSTSVAAYEERSR